VGSNLAEGRRGTQVAVVQLRMKLILAVSLLISMFSFGARALPGNLSPESSTQYSLQRISLDPEVRVESITRGGEDVEVVHLGQGEDVEIPVDMSIAKSLTPSQASEAREDSRRMLEGVAHAITSEEFNGEMAVDEDGTAEVLTATVDGVKAKRNPIFRQWLRRKLTTGWHEIRPDIMKGVPAGLSRMQKMKHMLQMAWQFAWVETVHSAIAYYDGFKADRSKLVEFGLSVDLKIEPQIFIGKFNPTQKVKALRNSYALGLEVSFDKSKKRVIIRTRLRREKGSGGLGLPAAKLELKVFETDGTHRVQGGQSWYPVSPPFASFVLDRDHGGHYFAQGITFGANTGDLIPFSTLTNTFADYQQKENALSLRSIPMKISSAFTSSTTPSTPPSSGAMVCSALFAAP
jgi:hypothetical protein